MKKSLVNIGKKCSFSTDNNKDWSKLRSLDLSKKPPAFDMKYFITKKTIL